MNVICSVIMSKSVLICVDSEVSERMSENNNNNYISILRRATKIMLQTR